MTTIPGGTLNGQGGQFQSYAIRGFSRSRIRTEVDGIPIITDRRAGNSISFISTGLLYAVQVQKGPSSVLYGSQALGGVVNLSTAIIEPSLEASVSFNNNAVNLTAKNVFDIKDDQVRAGLSIQQAKQDESANGEALNTEFERVSSKISFDTQFLDIDTRLTWLGSIGQDIGKSNNQYPETEVSNYPSEEHSLTQLQLNHVEGGTFKLFHHYQNWDNQTDKIDRYLSLNDYQSHTMGAQWLNSLTINNIDSYVGIDWLARKGVDINNQNQLYDDEISFGMRFEGQKATTHSLVNTFLVGIKVSSN
ncbi:TonB-dependent receptor plug domain-containing protein [Catenovulum sp. SM1970]|nr:TonB-dependent receptor plug domain-containing protein [Marinifaba aquimaris]